MPEPAPPLAPPLILRGAAVWDHTSRSFRSDLDVSCRGGRIEALGASPGAADAAVLDCTGRFLLPGLIDCHVHITASGDPADLNQASHEPRAIRAWRAARHAEATLAAGFTTVRDLGAHRALNVELATAIESGLVPGPRILAAGEGVTMTGGHGHGFIAREADGADGVRRAVRAQLKAGARAIKLFASGGVLTAGVDPRSPSFTEEELAAGVEEAHKAFRVVAAHAQATDGIKNAIRAGVDSIEHGVWLDDEAIALMLEQGTYLVPTLTAPALIADGGLAAGIPAYAVEKAEQVRGDHLRSFAAAVTAGVRVAMGTDQGTPLSRPGDNAQEILWMAAAGLSKHAAILAATAWAADLLHIDAGRVEPGKLADFVLVESDPLGDLGVLARPGGVVGVIAAGRVVRWPASPSHAGGVA